MKPDLDHLHAIIDAFSGTHILVVGDLMLDRFIWGKVDRISPEAPVPVVRVTRESCHLGGAANVVSNLHALGGHAVPLGVMGTDATGEDMKALLKNMQVSTEGLIEISGYDTIQKTRIIAHHQQVCRVDRERESGLEPQHHREILKRMQAMLPQSQALIVSDYGKGVITPELLQVLSGTTYAGKITVDPKDRNFSHYRNVFILTPNQNEAERMSGVRITDETSLRRAAAAIFKMLNCRHLLITRGEHGMALFLSPEDLVVIDTVAREVFDVSGAGDTVIATFTLAIAAGASPHQAAVLANAAAGVVVGKLGTATLSADELRKAIS